MKNLLGYSSLLLLLLLSCRKDESTAGCTLNRITGKWELRHIEGGFGPSAYYPPGNGYTLNIGESFIERNGFGGPVSRLPYSKTQGFCQQTNRNMAALLILNQTVFYEFSKDTLVMYNGTLALDGTIEKFVPVQ